MSPVPRMPRKKRPFLARIEEVTIRKDNDYAEIAYKDPNIMTTHLTVGPEVKDIADEDILQLHNDCIRARDELARKHKYAAVEVPLGRPQIRYCAAGDQWLPRGHVLRCVVEDGADEGHATVYIDERPLSMDQFGKLLTTFAGWGMRIEFVDGEEDIHRRPVLEVRDPEDDEE